MLKPACDKCGRTDRSLEKVRVEFKDGRLELELCANDSETFRALKTVGVWKPVRTRKTFTKTSLTELLEDEHDYK